MTVIDFRSPSDAQHEHARCSMPLTLVPHDPSELASFPQSGLQDKACTTDTRQNVLHPDQPCPSALCPACTVVAFPTVGERVG